MADDADRAGEAVERAATSAIARARRALAPRERAGTDCDVCREPIPPARLAAMPAARRCVECADDGRGPWR